MPSFKPSGDVLEPIQIDVRPLPGQMEDDAGEEFDPCIVAAVGAESAFCYGFELEDAAIDPAQLIIKRIESLFDVLPPRRTLVVQVTSTDFAMDIREAGFAGIEVVVVPDLPALDFMLTRMQGDLFAGAEAGPLLDLLEQPGVTIDIVRGFAEGCALYHRRAPWRLLYDDNLIVVTAPAAPRGLACGSVLGAGGEVFGIGFFPDEASHVAMCESDNPTRLTLERGAWSLMFYGEDDVPPSDKKAWKTHKLPRAEDGSIPILLRYAKDDLERPDAARLAFVEGLCRAIAATTDVELAEGFAVKEVTTSQGPRTYTLTIPSLRDEPPSRPAPRSPRSTPRRSTRCGGRR